MSLEIILSNMMEGVVAIDSNSRVLFLNQAMARLFDVDSMNAKGKHLLEVVRQNQINSMLQSVLLDKKNIEDEVRTFSPDERIFEAKAAPLMEEEKQIGALLVLHDVTQIRKLEQVRRDFVANVSHEMRTPLASIKGFAETLREGALKDPKVAWEFLNSIEKHADNMTTLVEDLLSLAAIESGQRAPRKERVILNSFVADIIEGLQPLAKKSKIEISFHFSDPKIIMEADAAQMKQIFVNLIENGIKFNEPEGHVNIDVIKNDDGVMVNVSDTGIGIPAQDIPRIFERFYRVDKARSRAMGGTGLGLSIVKHLVEANGGTISVESSIGKGSAFRLTFPAIQK